jgi:hypothetical protein
MDELMYKLKEQIIKQLSLNDKKPEDIGDDEPLFVEGLGLDCNRSIKSNSIMPKRDNLSFVL